jgi:hypothetical protein
MTDHEPRHRATKDQPATHHTPWLDDTLKKRLHRPEADWNRLDWREPKHAAPTVVDETW